MFRRTIRLEKALFTRVKRCADIAGSSSVGEFVAHALDKQLAAIEESDSEADIKKKLKGLGYIS